MFRIVLVVVILCYSCVSAWQSASSVSGRRLSLSMIANGRKPLMGGNWKMMVKSVQESTNLATEVAKLTKGVTDVDIVLVSSCHLYHYCYVNHHLIIIFTIISSLSLP